MKTIHSFEHPPHVFDSRSMFWRMNYEMDWIISEIAVQATGIDDFFTAIKSRILNVEKSSNHSGEWIELSVELQCFGHEIPHIFVESTFVVNILTYGEVIEITSVIAKTINGEDVGKLEESNQLTKYWTVFEQGPIQIVD